MEDPKTNRLGFPEPFEYLNDLIADDLERLKEIENIFQKKSLPNEKSNPYRLDYNIPSFLGGRPSKNYNAINDKLESEKEAITSRVNRRINFELKELNVEADLKEKIEEIVLNELYPNKFSKLPMEEIVRQAETKKDFNTSHDYLNALHDKSNGEKSFDKIIKNQDERKDKRMSMGLKFIQSLSSSSITTSSPNPPTVTISKDKDDFLPDE